MLTWKAFDDKKQTLHQFAILAKTELEAGTDFVAGRYRRRTIIICRESELVSRLTMVKQIIIENAAAAFDVGSGLIQYTPSLDKYVTRHIAVLYGGKFAKALAEYAQIYILVESQPPSVLCQRLVDYLNNLDKK